MRVTPFLDSHGWQSVLVSAAKTARLRQAKEEAEKEAALYRAQREEEYQNKKSGVRMSDRF